MRLAGRVGEPMRVLQSCQIRGVRHRPVRLQWTCL